MRILVIDSEAMGLDFVLRCTAAGHEVRWFIFSTKPTRDGEGFTGLKIVPDWRPEMPWVGKDGLIVTTGNWRFLHELDRFRELGYKVFSPTVASSRLEIDREAGMKAMQAAGIELPPYETFDSLDAAAKFARKSDRAWVFKPMGDESDKAMTYVADDPADLCGWLERQIAAGKKLKGSCMLQEKVDMLAEIGVSGWMGPDGFLEEKWQVCFEHKKLMDGEIGPACYSDDTEVLTEDGWKFWPDVTASDRIAILENGYMQYEKPTKLVAAPFAGEMVAWQSNRIDILVTPGHQMYVADRNTVRTGDPEFEHLPAHEVANNGIDKKHAVLRTANWAGERYPRGPAYARLLGMFLADGCCRQRSIVFGNCPKHKEVLIRAAALAVGYTAHRYGRDVYINSRDLVNAWLHHPKSPEKRAPREIMDATPDVISAFLDGLALDATTKAGNMTYTTASRGMADDIQTMLIRVGLGGDLRERDRRDEPDRVLNGYTIKGSLAWDIGVSTNALAWLRPRFCRRVPYNGMVYCATVSSHTMMVRRNGKACWNGNTGEQGTLCQYTETDKLADEMLKPMEPILRALGHRGDFAVGACIDTKGRAWPFEFTARLGWPAFFIQMASHRGDPATWMRDLLDGKDSLRVSYDVAIGVVMAQPRYPYAASPPELVEGNPIAGIDEIRDQAHLVSVMRGKGPMMDDGKVVNGPIYQTTDELVLVVTGLGKSIEKARAKVYGAVEKIHYPNAIYRTDIGLKIADPAVLDKLHRFGYSVDLT